ncbi:MAG: diaminopimelate decarboxylase [Desulfobacterales bacterium]|nr:diaminopimelate decarboxylase [Desulfobacterales bacterium]
MSAMEKGPRAWWEREDLGYRDGKLLLGDQELSELAKSAGTPVFAYNSTRIENKLDRLSRALEKRGVRYRIFYALKANRFPPLVAFLKFTGKCGVDVCSPGELKLARQTGFQEEEISYTGTSVSNEDLACLRRHSRVLINCDAISAIRRLGERCPGRAIGVRINPQLGLGYHQGLHYSGNKATKFGVYRDRFQEALEAARAYDLRIRTLHFHIGCGYMTKDIEALDEILEKCRWFLDQCPEIEALDIGGGLGSPLLEGQAPLDLDRWAGVIAKHANPRGLEVHIEPGDYLMKDAGVLLLRVNTVEEKGGVKFIGVDGGFNLQSLAVYYNTPFIIAPLRMDPGARMEKATIAGNINEATDLWGEEILLPPVREGDYLGVLNVGGYGSSSSSNHCMRGEFSEYLLFNRRRPEKRTV